ncbi:MAG: ABC transporter substrate-binding protein [Sodalis sp. (in: enterobacteria)]|uniref:ABC transporter substrate-binding protein n=1 Tax=Sodalis sp. (in: enterobacteria) TaxID=1898979 RepID=UPI003F2F075D
MLKSAGNQRWLEKNPQLAKALMRATARSVGYVIEHPDEATTAFAAKYSKSYDANFVKQQWHDTMQVLGAPGVICWTR